MKEERVTNMTIGKQIPLLVKFTLPLIGGQMLQQLYVIVDTIIIGQALGVKALAAVGATDWLYWLFLWTAAGFGQGFAIPVAIRFGSNDLAGVRSSIYTSVFTSGFIGVFMAITGVIIAKPLLLLVDTPNELLLHSLNYLKVLYLGIFVVMLYNMSACILRALGDGRTPFIALIISSIINVILDFIFILGFDWGVEGAAVATVISQSIATFYSFCVMFRIKIMRGSFAAWKLSILEVKIHLCKGVPIAFQMLFIALGGILLQSINNQYGVVFVAAVTADNKIFGVLEAVAMSLGYGMTTYMGQNYGARKFDRIREGMRAALIISAVVSVVIALIMVIFGKIILSLFISGDSSIAVEALEISYKILCIMSMSLIVLHMLHVYRHSLAGLGITLIPMISGFVEGSVRGCLGLVFSFFFGITGLMFVEVFSWFFPTLLVFVAYYIVLSKLKKQDCDES